MNYYGQDGLERFLVSGYGPHYLVNKAKEEAVILSYRKIKDHFGFETVLGGVNVGYKVESLLNMLKNDCKVDAEKIDKMTLIDPNDPSHKIIQGFHVIKIDHGTFLIINSKTNYGTNYHNDKNNNAVGDFLVQTDVYLYFLGKKSLKWYNRLTEKLKGQKSDKVVTAFTVTTSDDGYWYCTAKDLAHRSFDTLYFDNDIPDQIKNHLDKWMANKDIFVERGLMFKTGILLYGSPGTGKSSLATAIASYLGCDMIIIDTSTFDKLKINEVTNSIDADDDMYVVLLDEVDTLFKSRDDKDITDDQKKVVDKLLAFLDSAQSPNNVVFVATTNYIENLDKAVRRKGRFDKEFEILDISPETARKMCEGFNLDKETTDEIITSRMAKGNRINPADLQVEIISRMRAKDINYDADMEILTSMEEKEERDKADAEALKDISKNEKKEDN